METIPLFVHEGALKGHTWSSGIQNLAVNILVGTFFTKRCIKRNTSDQKESRDPTVKCNPNLNSWKEFHYTTVPIVVLREKTRAKCTVWFVGKSTTSAWTESLIEKSKYGETWQYPGRSVRNSKRQILFSFQFLPATFPRKPFPSTGTMLQQWVLSHLNRMWDPSFWTTSNRDLKE